MATKVTRISFATDDSLERKLRVLADDAGMYLSPYIEMVLKDHVGSKGSKRDLPLSAQTYHMFEDIREAEADGILSAIEREHISDHITEILAGARQRHHRVHNRKNVA